MFGGYSAVAELSDLKPLNNRELNLRDAKGTNEAASIPDLLPRGAFLSAELGFRNIRQTSAMLNEVCTMRGNKHNQPIHLEAGT